MNKTINDFKNILPSEVMEKLKESHNNSIISFNENYDKDNNKVIIIKDIHSNLEMKTTMASKMLDNYIAPYESTVVKKLKEAGFNILATANLDEFAMGSTNLTSYYGGVDNAYDNTRLSGGSSGGSAYLVAKGLIPVATGTDTGGSVRQPAAFNGVYGMKPTYGIISRYGTLALSSSFDTVGVVSNSVEDNMTVLNVLAGNDNFDQTNYVPASFDIYSELDESLAGKTIGVFYDWINEEGVDPEIKASILIEIEKLKKLGCKIVDISVPLTTYSFELYVALAYAEASSNLNRYDGIRFGNQGTGNDLYKSSRDAFGSEVKKRLIIGTYMINNDHSKKFYQHAQKLRKKIADDFSKIFEECYAIIGPTTPSLAFVKGVSQNNRTSYLSDKFSIPANLVGIPALNVPITPSKEGQKIGMQIMANKYDEAKIYNIAKRLEESND